MNSAISAWNTTAESWWSWIVSADWQSAVVGPMALTLAFARYLVHYFEFETS